MNVDTRQWTPAIVKNVRIIGQLSFGYKWMHTKAAKEFARRYRIMIHTSSILSGIASFLLLLEAILIRPNHPNTYVLPLISAVFSTIAALLTEVINACDYQELSGDHQAFAAKYTSIVSEVQRQLILEYADRDEAAAFLSYLAKDFDQLFELAPLLRPSFIEAYTQIAEKKGWPIPEETLLDMCAADIINKDNDVPIVVHHPAVNVNERLDAFHDKEIPEVLEMLPKPDHTTIDLSDVSPLSVVNGSPDWSLRNRPSVGAVRTPSRKERKLPKNPVSSKVIVEVNRFNDQRMQFEMNRMQK